MSLKSNDLYVSFLVPVFNEEDNIFLFFKELRKYLSSFLKYEIIFIDDGSTDKTLQNIKLLQKSHENIQFVTFSRNFGHQNALKAGFDYCSGDVVISMDGDLQHPPSLIPQMIKYWNDGYDIVITRRCDSEDPRLFKKLTSRYYYRLLTTISSIDLNPGAADFRLLDRKVVNVLKGFSENDLFYRGFVSWAGFRQVEIAYRPTVRISGETKYTLKKMFRLASSGLLGFSVLPLRFATLFGFVISCISFMYGFYGVFNRFFTEETVLGWTSVMTGIYFLGGIQLVCVGICGEYIGRIFMQVKKRPHYIVSDTSLGS